MLMPILRTSLFAIVLSLGAIFAPGMASDMEASAAAKATVSADQIRAQWATMKQAYLDSVAHYAGQPQFAGLIQEYSAALDETGQSLEAFIALKQTTPPVPATAMTPAVDRLVKNLTQLKLLQGKAKGKLITIIGGALKQQQQITQNAIKNMR